MSTVIVILLVAMRIPLFRMFTSDQNVIEIGSRMVLLITPWYVVYVFIEVLAGAMRGVGDVLVPMIITLVGICLLRIAWLVGAMEIAPTINAIIFSYPVTWILTALAFILYYSRKAFLENKKKIR